MILQNLDLITCEIVLSQHLQLCTSELLLWFLDVKKMYIFKYKQANNSTGTVLILDISYMGQNELNKTTFLKTCSYFIAGSSISAALTLVLVSSMAAMGLLMLFTNLLTCSKCRVISVASTMSIMACRSVRNWFLSQTKCRQLRLHYTHEPTAKREQSGCGRPVCVLEDVALAVSDGELEGQGGVVALQHGRVVVQDGQFAAGVAEEGVGPARVVHVVHRGCYQGGHLVQLVQTALNETEEKQADVSPPLQCEIKECEKNEMLTYQGALVTLRGKQFSWKNRKFSYTPCLEMISDELQKAHKR